MQQSETKGIQEEAWLGGYSDPLGTVQDTEILPYGQMEYAQIRNYLRKGDKLLSGILRCKQIIQSMQEKQF